MITNVRTIDDRGGLESYSDKVETAKQQFQSEITFYVVFCNKEVM